MVANEWDEYLVAWRKRADRQKELNRLREARAREDALTMATVLGTEFGVLRVYLIGSLVRPGTFRSDSDIDLVVEGIEPGSFTEAERRLEDITDIPFDLLDITELGEIFRGRVLQEGVVLYERG